MTRLAITGGEISDLFPSSSRSIVREKGPFRFLKRVYAVKRKEEEGEREEVMVGRE